MTTLETTNQPEATSGPRPDAALPGFVAGALAFFLSAAILMLEILGVRVLAPYVGATLQTYTAIIGTVLTGISLGTWLGGKIADHYSPRKLLGPLIVVGGITVLMVVPSIRTFAPGFSGSRQVGVITLSFIALFFPAAILSAVNPALVKLQLSSLASTGSVVGRLSALATAGAIVGTFGTGFLLVATIPTSWTIGITGIVLVMLGLILSLLMAKRSAAVVSGVVGAVLVAGPLTLFGGNVCDKETAYYCISMTTDEERPTGRYVILDDHFHSYTDLKDPSFLKFGYVRRIGATIDSQRPAGEKVRMMSIGGGGFTLPRYVASTRPGSYNRILEVDPTIVEMNKERLGLETSELMSVNLGDGRIGIRSEPSASYDFVVGDAFGQEAVPWHLTTQEFMRDINRVMKPNGVYAMNIIDYDKKSFVRAEIKTLQSVFAHVVFVTDRVDSSSNGANFIAIASQSPIDIDALKTRLDVVEESAIVSGSALNDFVGDAMLLTDNFAPVDQLITPPEQTLNRRAY